MGILEEERHRVDGFGLPRNGDAYDQRIRDVHRDGSQGLERSLRRRPEMQRLSGHHSRYGDNRVVVPGETVDRQSNKGPRSRLTRFDSEPRLLRANRVKGRKHQDESRLSVVDHLSKTGCSVTDSATGCRATGRM